MKNLTDDRPKCLVEICGQPLLEWQLTSLRDAGIDQIAIVTGYKRELHKTANWLSFFILMG
jgi:NDP-sugar pyrophosphorylase family protein